jgi:hypothetical protein
MYQKICGYLEKLKADQQPQYDWGLDGPPPYLLRGNEEYERARAELLRQVEEAYERQDWGFIKDFYEKHRWTSLKI